MTIYFQRLVIGLTVSALLIGCGGDATQPAAADAALAQSTAAAETPQADDLASDDVAYLTRLGLIRGHLLAGVTLYRQGSSGHASSHMKHPGDELYAGLAAAFEARGSDGFADQLAALASGVEEQQGVENVNAAYQRLLDAIDQAETAVGAEFDGNLSDQRAVIQNLLDNAAREYGIGVNDGRVVDVHEYQDAWGFTQVALARARDAAAENPAAWNPVVEAIGSLQPLWPALTPDEAITVYTDAFAAALAALE